MRWFALLANVLLLLLIFYLGTMPGGPSVDVLPGKDKAGHALAFGALALVQLWGLAVFRLGSPVVRPWLAALLASAIGGLLELVQSRIPSREADVLDLVADAMGAFFAVLVVVLLVRRFRVSSVGTRSKEA